MTLSERYNLPQVPVLNSTTDSLALDQVYIKELVRLIEKRYERDIYQLGYENNIEVLQNKLLVK
jgi:hypothetical protein